MHLDERPVHAISLTHNNENGRKSRQALHDPHGHHTTPRDVLVSINRPSEDHDAPRAYHSLRLRALIRLEKVIGQLTRQTTVERIWRRELTVAAAKGLSRHEPMTA
jgi:hypothetical protein